MPTGIATIADIEEIESVPLERRDLPASTYEAIQLGSAINPDKIALEFFLEGLEFNHVVFYTYHDLIALINQTANMFNGLGISQNDVVSMILPNLPQTCFTIWGGEAAGIINPISPMLEPAEMADIMNAAGTKLLVTLAPFIGTDIWQKVASIAGQVPTLQTILQINLANYLSTVQKLAVKWMLLRGDTGPKVQVPVYDFVKTARRFTGEKLLSDRQFQPQDIAAYFHAGGTAGIPKIVQHTHFNEVLGAWSAAEMISLAAKHKVFCGSPLFQANNVIISGLMPWMRGASVVIGSPSGFRSAGVVENFWKIIDFYNINFFSGDLPLFDSLRTVPIEDEDISALEFTIGSIASMPIDVILQFEALTKIRFLGSYGLPEGTGFSAINPLFGENRAGSSGLRLPYQEMAVVQVDEAGNFERACAVNEPGLVILRGPNIFSGYVEGMHNRPRWVDTGDGQGSWLNSGDLGRQDEQGYFWFTGPGKG